MKHDEWLYTHDIRQAADRGIDRLDRSDEIASATATVVDCEIRLVPRCHSKKMGGF